MIDQELMDCVQRYIDNDDDLHPDKAQELLNNYIKVIEDNAELHKQKARYETLIEDIAALGFLEPSFDSGKSHKDVCKKFKELFPDDDNEL